MARKRSSGGRARRVTPASRIYLQAEKINRRIRNLERNNLFGNYKSRELIRFAKNYGTYLSLNRGRGSKRARLRIRNIREATLGQLKVITKKFTETLKAKAFSTVGIKKIRVETRKEVAKTLGGMIGRKLTDKDTDLFYEIIKYKSDEIISRIGPSEFFVLVETARQAEYTLEAWVMAINMYVEINNDVMRKAAEYLYEKFVK